MSQREGYKKTEIGWIPEDWDVSYLEDITRKKILDGTHFTPNYSKDGVPFLRVTDIKEGKINLGNIKYIPHEEHKQLIKRCLPEKGDILYSKNGTIGITKIIDWEWEFSIFVSLALIKPDPSNVLNLFLKYLLDSKYASNEIKIRAKQGTVTNLHLEEIRKFRFPIPPLPEQQKIASILTTVDDKISSIDQQIQQTEQLKKGLMEKLLTEGIGHTEFKDTEIGRIPKEWDVRPLGELGVFLKGKGIAKKDLIEDGLPCIRYGEIYTVHNWIIKKFHSFITSETASQSTEIKKDDILFAGSGETVEDIGKAVAFLGQDKAYAGGDVIILRPKNIDSAFISSCLETETSSQQKRKLGQGHSVVHIYSSGLKTLLVPVPPLPEQQKIASILSSVDDKIETLTQKKSEYQTLKKGLMAELLTGKRRVKV